ncbi:MAG: methyl-accepting chemotaxis sensory transducer [Bacillota bacterium]|jgi:methyl-accepting chemotaxis protein|nr:methyl-accepting chemotaxis sensory transducer [Bacillota bacterium]
MKNLSISKKLLIGFGTILAFMLLSIILSMVSIGTINEQVELYGKYTVPNNNSVWMMRRDMVSAQRYVVRAFVEKDVKLIEENFVMAQKDGEAIMKELERYTANQRNTERDEKIKEFKGYLEQAGPVRRQIAELMKNPTEENVQAGYALFLNEYVPTFDKAAEILVEFTESSNQRAIQQRADADAAAKMATILQTVFGILAMLISIGLGFLISRSINGPINKLVEAAKQLADGNTDFDLDIDSKNEVGVLASAFRSVIASLKRMVNDADKLVESSIKGDLHVRADADQNKGDFRKIIAGVNKTLDVLVGHIDLISNPVLIIDNDYNIRYMNQSGAALLGKTQSQLIGQKCYDQFNTSDCKTSKCACARAMQEKNQVQNETDAHPNGMNLDITYIGSPIFDHNNQVIGALEVLTDLTEIKTAQRLADKRGKYQTEHIDRLVVNLERLARGELDCDMMVTQADADTEALFDLFTKVSNNLHDSMNEMKRYINEVAQVLSEVSDGNLRVGINSEYKGEFIQIKDSINNIVNSLNNVLGIINTAAEQVSTGSAQVSSGAQALAAGSSEQASSVEELSVSITRIAEQATENSANVKAATEYVEQAGNGVNAGNEHMKQLTEAMENIGSASNQIDNITKVIEDIAFQTNILALNAAIEAARAGNAGKGFAVVADEVRSLAAKSAEAAQQTAELIRASVATVSEGSKITNQTAKILEEVQTKALKVSESIVKIEEASADQATAIEQIKQGLSQVSAVVQANAATAEENSATSEEMSAQAATLREEVGKFKLDGYGRDHGTSISLFQELPRPSVKRIGASSDLGKY